MVIVRPFRESDAGALAALFHASVRDAGHRDYTSAQVEAWSPGSPDPAVYLARARDRVVLVAETEGGEVVGYGDLGMDGHIDHLYRHPDHVGTGIGSAIYRALEAQAMSANIGTLRVEASEAARRLFLGHGFRVDGRNDFVLRGVPIHNYRMSKVLAFR
ncbi:MAG: hypothetical protein GAK28_02809 [Luteibacter sp.]|nr:MAG: hypothetical protein GAK28_02809 [Luteibacter sp.]